MMGDGKVFTSHEDLRTKVIHFAISSRLLILLLSFISNFVLPDHEAGVFMSPQRQASSLNQLDRAIYFIVNGTVRWDAQYFIHISNYGYTYENTLAFFPLFPFIVHVVSFILHYVLGSFLHISSTILISSLVLNLVFFVKAATALFELSLIILKDIKLAYLSALFFCINPASIFFTVPYTEACYAYFTFSGMLFYLQNKTIVTNLALGLSCLVRSNGIVSFGFVVHKGVKRIVDNFSSLSDKKYALFYRLNLEWVRLFFSAVIFFTPFLLFQFYAYTKYCIEKSEIPEFLEMYGKLKGYKMPNSESSLWCNYTIPFSYSYVQNYYWNVGFLQYYELKQIPNFLLALPIFYLVLSNIYLFYNQNKNSMILLGLKDERLTFNGVKVASEMVVFVFHLLFLSIFCAFFINIQVSTRLLASSSPLLYWFVACRYRFHNEPISSRLCKSNYVSKYCLVEKEKHLRSYWKNCVICEKPPDDWTYYCRLYFCTYFFIGTILFSNFFPWT